MTAPGPISNSEFEALMAPLGPFPSGRRVMAAVSGGPDSMGLALLLSRWGRPLGCIIDHGLRPESAAEAALAAARLDAIGVPARILAARLRPGPAASERARAARYALLLQACAEAGCTELILAHHALDQAETVHMRAAAGSAAMGLAGMAAVTYRTEARLLRPLLPVQYERLRATLIEAGIAWSEDPTNLDRRTRRGALRASMDGEAIALALRTAARHGPARHVREQEIAAELGSVRFYPEGFAVASAPLGPEALSALLWTVSGQPHPPPRAALVAGLARRTTHGVLLRPAGRHGPGTLVAREPAAVAAPVPAGAGVVWDGRFRLEGRLPQGVTLGALGRDAARFRGMSALPSVVLQTLPALRHGDELVAIPHLCFARAEMFTTVHIRFCPARPAAGAPFVSPPFGLYEAGDVEWGDTPHVD